jgi:hypothetical protein
MDFIIGESPATNAQRANAVGHCWRMSSHASMTDHATDNEVELTLVADQRQRNIVSGKLHLVSVNVCPLGIGGDVKVLHVEAQWQIEVGRIMNDELIVVAIVEHSVVALNHDCLLCHGSKAVVETARSFAQRNLGSSAKLGPKHGCPRHVIADGKARLIWPDATNLRLANPCAELNVHDLADSKVVDVRMGAVESHGLVVFALDCSAPGLTRPSSYAPTHPFPVKASQ